MFDFNFPLTSMYSNICYKHELVFVALRRAFQPSKILVNNTYHIMGIMN